MKPWQKDSNDPTFNEFYTTAEQCDIIFSEMIPIMYKQPFEIDDTKCGVPGKYVRICLRRKSK